MAQAKKTKTTQGALEALRKKDEAAVATPEATAEEKQHARGKKTARERVEQLLDPESFVEFDRLVRHRSHNFGFDKNRPFGDGVVAGYGTIDGRQVAVYSQDFTVFGGSLGEVHGQKITKVQDFALKTGVPLIGISDGGGARIQEGVAALTQFAEIFRRNVASSGVIPQISIILGAERRRCRLLPRAHGLHRHGRRHLANVHHRSRRHQVGHRRNRDLRGAGRRPHAQRQIRGGALPGRGRRRRDQLRPALAAVPAAKQPRGSPAWDAPADLETTDADLALDTMVPDSDNQPYDMKTVIETVVDEGEFFEIQPLFAPNVVIGFGHVEGHSVGIVANQPLSMAGTLDINAAEKAARFVRTCDAFNIPVLTFVDVPGFLPGTDQEYQGIIRRGAKLIYAYAEATVPLITVITRKAYGGAYIVMASKQLGADINLAWPSAQIAVMGASGAVNILQRRTLAAVAEKGGDVEAERAIAHRRLRGPHRQSVRRRRSRLRGRGDRAPRDAGAHRARAASATHQARRAAAQEAWQHPPMTTPSGASDDVLDATSSMRIVRGVPRRCRTRGPRRGRGGRGMRPRRKTTPGPARRGWIARESCVGAG